MAYYNLMLKICLKGAAGLVLLYNISIISSPFVVLLRLRNLLKDYLSF